MSEAWEKSAEQKEREQTDAVASDLLNEIFHRAVSLNDNGLERAVYVQLNGHLEQLIAQMDYDAGREEVG